ncbi:MAG: hypothetical protein DRQ65_07530 [Gammaproteobacteria bacterium]|nr:MAG: hypothetical protein DRQ65_07530 [Gammaproteobacteria bacterium]
MTTLQTWLGYCLVALLACQATSGMASTVEELQAAGRLEVAGNISPAEDLVPGQKITLTLQIDTDRWFTGGTRISIPEVPGLVILQTEQFATNASEKRDGVSWVVQRWTLDVFPQRAGNFTIPPIRVQVKVNTDESEPVEGALHSLPIHFSTVVPEALAEIDHWVAAPAFEVRQSFDRPLEALEAGDAFELEVMFEAEDVMAMMLPAFTPEKLPGLAAYPLPPVLHNSNNRGQARASRTQRISYVVEAEGHYLLPARDYFWWDTRSKQLQLLSLPATEITVGTGSAQAKKRSLAITPRQLLALGVALVLLAGLIWLAWKWLPRLPLARCSAALLALWQQLLALRKPALPRRLNPDNSSGD